MTFVAKSLKNANAIIEAIHAADLKEFQTHYTNDDTNDFTRVSEWADSEFRVSVEIKNKLEIVEKSVAEQKCEAIPIKNDEEGEEQAPF